MIRHKILLQSFQSNLSHIYDPMKLLCEKRLFEFDLIRVHLAENCSQVKWVLSELEPHAEIIKHLLRERVEHAGLKAFPTFVLFLKNFID